jgi:hypothetical protein
LSSANATARLGKDKELSVVSCPLFSLRRVER